MGQEELKAALRDKGRQRIEALWDQARAEEQSLAAETTGRLEQRRELAAGDGWASGIPEASALVLQAERAARARLVAAKRRLAERLHAIASLLVAEPDFLLQDRVVLLQRFAAELPQVQWQRVRVAPQDEEIARETFPDASVIVDEALCGGFVAESGDGLTVTNTLEKRLERCWPELLPHLMQLVMETDRRDQSA